MHITSDMKFNTKKFLINFSKAYEQKMMQKRQHAQIQVVKARRLDSKARISKKHTFDGGFQDAEKQTLNWNSQTCKPRVYVFGNRMHHGLAGTILLGVGLYYKVPYLVGYGTGLVVDDIHDAEHWLDFESGGDPNAIIDVV